MDKTEKYAKMSEAEEIQNQAPRETGDVYFLPGGEIHLYGYPSFYWLENYGNGTPCRQWVGDYDTDRPDYYGSKATWLPRQDELQQMLAHLEECSALLINRFKKFLDPMLSAHKFYWSMEQLWLAFVMKEKYQKVWDGERWM